MNIYAISFYAKNKGDLTLWTYLIAKHMKPPSQNENLPVTIKKKKQYNSHVNRGILKI